MTQKLPHLYLKNPSGNSEKFNKSRNITEIESNEKDPTEYTLHKRKLRSSLHQLINEREFRLHNKTIIQDHIEIVEIRFLIPFSDGAVYKTQTRFSRDFGLSAVMRSDFNRTVLFAITDEEKFRDFNNLLNKYIDSADQTSPQGTEYAIMTTLYDIKYHTADDIRNHCSGDLVFELIGRPPHIQLDEAYSKQQDILSEYLKTAIRNESIDDYYFDSNEKILQLKGATKDFVETLTGNFDILAKAHTLRNVVIKPDQFNNARLTWDFKIKRDPNVQAVIGIIDNGVRPIEPLEEIIMGGEDITNSNDALSADQKHGTVVASLAAVGEKFFNGESELSADANIYSIKVLENIDGYFDVIRVVEAIRRAHLNHGIRLFNLSVLAQSKSYNEAPSLFAFLLDQLAYELDILIFIAAGNMNYEDILAMQQQPDPLHNYPNHFYNPEKESELHSCVYTNICIPAESMNHVTVGAIAENYRDNTLAGLSLDKSLPAYYSRKNHYDFKQKVNGGAIGQNHRNNNLFKPDIVMPGGDVLDNDSAMQVVGFGDMANDYYAFDSGTSLAAPLAANLAAQLLNVYPELSLQSVKALLINSAEPLPSGYLNDLVKEQKNTLSLVKHGVNFDELNKSDKSEISKQILSEDNIQRNLSGYGRPNVNKLLYSSENEISLIVEDVIPTEHHKVFSLKVPDYLLEGNGQARLHIQATLCFKINPTWGNHVDYNPLHISFNFANGAIDESLDELTAILADRDHVYYKQNHWTDEIITLEEKKDDGTITDAERKTLNRLKSTAKRESIGIKKKLREWSEDFFPLVNKPLSNRQQHSIHIKKEEIRKIGNKIAIVIRCAIKENLDPKMSEWARRTPEHPFSLALSVKDISKIDGVRLYDELQAINITEIIPNNIAGIDTELDIDI